jgi:hypothetical protein
LANLGHCYYCADEDYETTELAYQCAFASVLVHGALIQPISLHAIPFRPATLGPSAVCLDGLAANQLLFNQNICWSFEVFIETVCAKLDQCSSPVLLVQLQRVMAAFRLIIKTGRSHQIESLLMGAEKLIDSGCSIKFAE